MAEFYLILSAVKPDIERGMFLRLLLGTVVMLAFGYSGEARIVNPFGGFVLGMRGWGFVLYEVFAGEAGQVNASGTSNKYVQESFNTMRFIVSVGWSIYPLGYFFGYFQVTRSVKDIERYSHTLIEEIPTDIVSLRWL